MFGPGKYPNPNLINISSCATSLSAPSGSSTPSPSRWQPSSTSHTSAEPETNTMMQSNYEKLASTYQTVVQVSTLQRPAHLCMTPSLELHRSLCSDFRWIACPQAPKILNLRSNFFQHQDALDDQSPASSRPEKPLMKNP